MNGARVGEVEVGGEKGFVFIGVGGVRPVGLLVKAEELKGFQLQGVESAGLHAELVVNHEIVDDSLFFQLELELRMDSVGDPQGALMHPLVEIG